MPWRLELPSQGSSESSVLPMRSLSSFQVKNFDAEKGFGFITPDGGDSDVHLGRMLERVTSATLRFVHFSSLPRGSDC